MQGSAASIMQGSASSIMLGSAASIMQDSAESSMQDSAASIMQGSAASIMQGSPSTRVWGVPMVGHLPSPRAKRRPGGKVWVNGKKGFRLGRRKTAGKLDKRIVTVQEADNKSKAKSTKKTLKSEINVDIPERLSIPQQKDTRNSFVDFGNRWRHAADFQASSVKVKRKKNSKSDSPRKGKHLKRPKAKDKTKAQIRTAKSYRMKTEDGSIKWGYVNSDGSYKEETIGIDCITRGKYGYIDPRGKTREYSYSMGVKCEQADPSSGARGPHDKGQYDYTEGNFVMQDGRRVRLVVNNNHRARG